MFSVNIDESKGLEYGIDVHSLKPGTAVIVATTNSIYKIVKGQADKYEVKIQGGKYIPEPSWANFSGSTFGGSMIKPGWIGYGMFMEFFVIGERNRYVTSSVRAAKIIGDGWEYDMDWGERKISVKPKLK